jgi:hypothetical protein
MDLELHLLARYVRFVRFWWLLAVAAIMGGGLGWLFSQFQPPIYVAKASLEVTVDFTQTGNLSPYNLDIAVGAIQAVFHSPAVLSQVQSRASDELPGVNTDQLSKQIGIERLAETWILRVKNTDPLAAAVLVNLWQDIGYQALIQARQHALNAQELRRYLLAAETCPSPSALDLTVPVICRDGITIDPAGVKETQDLIQRELASSYAIQPFLLFSQNSPAEIPEEPVTFQTKWLVTGGVLVFFLIAAGILQFYPLREEAG